MEFKNDPEYIRDSESGSVDKLTCNPSANVQSERTSVTKVPLWIALSF